MTTNAMKCETYMNVCLYTEAPKGGAWGWLDRVLGWQDRHRSRRTLAGLDDRMLKDIGITRDAAEQEVRRPFWMA